jgi:hypothetical protein
VPTIFVLASAAAYSSEIQQPWRVMTVLDCYLRIRYAAPFDREQGCAGSYGSEGWRFESLRARQATGHLRS